MWTFALLIVVASLLLVLLPESRRLPKKDDCSPDARMPRQNDPPAENEPGSP
jgi:hypothetical protein